MKILHKLKMAWKVLTSDDWFLITRIPPERPFTLQLPDKVEVRYK